MEFSNSYIATLREVFTSTYTPPNRTLNEQLFLDDDSIMSHYMELEMVNNNIEVPTFLRKRFENFIIRYVPNIESTSTFIVSLSQNEYSATATVATILKNGFKFKSSSSDIVKFITKDNEVYYVGKGLILNSEFKPLLYCTLSCSKEGVNYDYTNPKVYLDPTVFINSDTVSKNIIRKMIPCYVSIGSLGQIVSMNYTNFHYGTCLSKPEIIIKDLSNIIKSTNSPNSINITTDAHNLLSNHITELIDNL